MTTWLGTDTTPQQWALVVTAATPWQHPSVVVHRGLGGRTQTVWSAAPADAGQRLTHRCPVAQVPTLLELLARPQRVTITTDDPACAVLPGAGAITRVDVTYRYDIAPPIAEVSIEVQAA